nr:unnamed protein product [Spirometra erinaceieuropaei]
MEHLATVFDRLQQYGVVFNPLNCFFGVPSQQLLGHLVDSHGIRSLSLKAAAIRDFTPPSSKRQLQRFLDRVNFCRQFLQHCADTILPLTSLLSDPKISFGLSADALAAFDRMKAALADATLLTHFPHAPISLVIDASNDAIRVFLQKHLPGHTQTLSFFSKEL